LSRGETLADRQKGTALFADIGGFTPLAEAMEKALGAQRGAEELATAVNRIFDALIDATDRHHGSIVAFAGDAMTCWFDEDDGTSAIACALEMQTRMASAGQISVQSVETRTVGLKIAIAGGEARRFQVGDPAIQLLDVLAGAVADKLGEGEKLSRIGEVMVEAGLAESLGEAVSIERGDGAFLRVVALAKTVTERPWPPLGDERIAADTLRSWLLAPVYERFRQGQDRFLAEFRPVAALFASFDGMDYETANAGEVLDGVIRRAQEIVTRHGGSVFDVSTGDKGSYLLAVFGAPVAYGDDVRRSVAAADELRKGASTFRIGLNAGRVYAGSYAGSARSVYRVAGDAVNLAARLMTAARPGQVLMSGAVGASLDRRFSIHALEPIAVKSRRAPVAVCELMGAGISGAGLSEPRYPLPMIGRETELAAIEHALANAKAGLGNVLSFRADAGMGKSRLVNVTLQRATAAGFKVFAGECQPHGTGMAYLPWQPVWNALFGLPVDASTSARREALSATLGAAAPEAAALAPLLERLLDLPMDENDATRGMPAPVRKQVLEQMLAGVLRGRAAMGPVCIVLEDLHWMDSLSRDLLVALASAISDVPVIFVLAYRPLEPGASLSIPRMNEIELGELSGAEGLRLADMLLGYVTGSAGDEATLKLIAERANGNPFYIEELVRYIAERGGQTSDLPTSLESLVLGRIDRLSKTQQLIVKVASVIGRRFPVAWLTGAYGATLAATDVASELGEIRSTGLIVADTPPPEEANLFRHAVVRDVAYETLGFALRQSLHEQLASHLEALDSGISVDLLAYHFARSANATKEAHYRRLAAELAIRNGAYPEALVHVRRASEIVTTQSDHPQKLEQALELQLLLGTILLVVDGQGSATAKSAYDRARELSRSVPPGPAAGRAIFGLWTYYLFQGLMGPTEELADEAVVLTEMSPDPGLRIMAHLAVSQTHMWTGKWRKCVDHHERVVELYDPTQHQAYLAQYAQNPRFTASNSGFWGEWMLGNPERAHAVAETAIAEAAALNHDFTYVIAFLGRPMVAYFRRRHDLFAASTDEYLERARRAGNPFYVALALSLDATAKILRGEHDEGLAQLEAQDATMQALGSKLIDPFLVSLLAQGYLIAGRHEQGLNILDARFGAFVEEGRVSWIPDHLRLRSELELARDPAGHEAALGQLARAIGIAREHDAKAFELRAALAAARILKVNGQHQEARSQLGPIYAGFTEGFDDADLVEARNYIS